MQESPLKFKLSEPMLVHTLLAVTMLAHHPNVLHHLTATMHMNTICPSPAHLLGISNLNEWWSAVAHLSISHQTDSRSIIVNTCHTVHPNDQMSDSRPENPHHLTFSREDSAHHSHACRTESPAIHHIVFRKIRWLSNLRRHVPRSSCNGSSTRIQSSL